MEAKEIATVTFVILLLMAVLAFFTGCAMVIYNDYGEPTKLITLFGGQYKDEKHEIIAGGPLSDIFNFQLMKK